MTTLDAIILLLLVEALLAVAWVQWVKARRYGAQRPRGPVTASEAKTEAKTEAKDEPSGPHGPVLDRP